MDNNVELLKQAFTAIQKKNDKEKPDNSINMKPAKVIGTDDDTHKVFAYFLDDAEQQQYTFYNKSGEKISEGDTVKIFYTTNSAKGWVGARTGEPDIASNTSTGFEPITAITINSNIDYSITTNAGIERYVGIFEET